ncbi:MAG TPA: hypothetical protein VLF67_03975 [Candidatus Saccharimonas sp.]|nr:hypothetical protein [Candidatus Saccharimonas sp.]
MKTLTNLVINLAITSGLFWLFNFLGWVVINPDKSGQTTQDHLLGALAAGGIFTLVAFVLWRVLALSLIIPPLGCLAIIAGLFTMNDIVLHLMAHYGHNFLVLPLGFWGTWGISLLLLLGVVEKGNTKKMQQTYIRPQRRHSHVLYRD